MADFSEWYPISDGKHRFEGHKDYVINWNRINYEVVVESKKELFFFNRSRAKQIIDYSSMMWLGNQMTDYTCEDGLCSVFDGYRSSSDAGLPLVYSDIGGYTGVKKPIIKNVIRTKQLLLDWMKLEAFTPVFRSHEGILPDDNVQVYDTSVLNDYAFYSKLNLKLRPFFQRILSDRVKGIAWVTSILDSLLKHDYYTKGMIIGNEILIVFEGEKIEPINGWSLFSIPDNPEINTGKVQVYIKDNSNVNSLLKNYLN